MNDFACPRCRNALTRVSASLYHCAQDSVTFHRAGGIWRFLLPEQAARVEPFVKEYEVVRRAEGWGSDAADYYRALPFVAGRHRDIWRIRARSYRALMERVVQPMAAEHRRPLRILDAGAGNGWLSYRLAAAGHDVAAIDLATNSFDGLGTRTFYDADFTTAQAEFDRLPFAAGAADLLIYNGAFHYAARYETTLMEGLRVLAAGGRIVIMDSPLYRDGDSGRQMVRERQQQFQRLFGFAGDAVSTEGYLTFDRLDELTARTGVQWQMIRPPYGWRWALRPLVARLRGRREPATFLLLVGAKGHPPPAA